MKLLAVAVVLVSLLAGAQDRFRITGVVTDTEGSPLPDASIAIEGQADRAAVRAGADGRFEISNLAAGRHVVEVSLRGFRTETRTVEVGRNASAEPIAFKLRVGLLMEALFVLPEPIVALREADAVAHIRLDGLAPPEPCAGLVVIHAIHDATVLSTWRGTLPGKIQVLQDSAGECRDGAELRGGMNAVKIAGSEFIVFLTRAGTRFSGVGNGSYAFPVAGGRVTTHQVFGLAPTVTLDEFRRALQRSK